MYLKKLEIQGFKSFTEKIKLDFNTGITAVVGPNGSGKSNIADAVRWVLGEQSAKSLRGTKMEDIIFAGTENRKPLGFAEVSIIIDNSDRKLNIDFSEIKITRRVFRSGESEYKINAVSCRLKDIHQMFMDTGIGKEGYSIIGQGRVEEILSSRSEDRRYLFEEAAGIVKYKNRKNETESKLEREQQNLIRVLDILKELEAQISPLEQKSDRARQYLIFKEREKNLKINLFLINIVSIAEDENKLEKNKNDLNSELEVYRKESIKIQEKINSNKKEVVLTEKKIKEINEELAEIRSTIEQKENDVKFITEQNENLKIEFLRLEGENFKKTELIEKLKFELEDKKNIVLQLEEKLLKQNLNLNEAQKKYTELDYSIKKFEELTQNHNKEVIEQIKNSAELKNKNNESKLIYEQLEEKKENIMEKLYFTKNSLKENNESLAALIKAKENIDNFIIKTDETLKFLTEENINILATEEKEKNSYDATIREVTELLSSRKLILELQDSYEGYYSSVKNLLIYKKNNKGSFPGICGVLAELMEMEEGYETAIEIALGSSAQNIVTKTEEDAKEAIEHLKKSKSGRITFLPINAIRAKEIKDKEHILKEKGVLGVAKDFIHCEHSYKEIFDNFLGKVIVIDNTTNAINFHRKFKHIYKIVTLGGELFNIGGSITGGSINKQKTSIFGRTKELKNIIHTLEIKEKTKESLEKKLKNLQLAKENNISKINENNNVLQEKKLEKAIILENISNVGNLISDFEKKLKDFAEEDSILLKNIETKNKEIRTLEQDLHTAENIIKNKEKDLIEHQQNALNSKEARDLSLHKLSDIKIAIGKTENDKISKEQDLLRIKNTLAQDEEEIKINTEKMLKNKKIITEKNYKIIDLQNEFLKVNEFQKEKFKLLVELEKRKTELLEISDKTYETEKSETEVIMNLKAEQARLELKINQLKELKKGIFNYMWEEYEVTYQSAKEYPKLELSFNEMKLEEKDIRNKLATIGAVDVDSIEEYKLVKERFESITKQYDDIVEAEIKLRKLLKELSELMEKQFKEQFELISNNFSIVFAEMFAGGNAYLKLSDEHDLLNSGIDIVAKPPGKTLQSMSLLSGGERSLTATALLFAILKMKPSPFCILDEVEAALDDANVTKYANFIKNFSKETQFIVITHRKGTMEIADILYGVTMQEQGVSKLVSVNFSEESI